MRSIASLGRPWSICVRSMVGPVRVATNMRIEGSLDQCVAHFDAEFTGSSPLRLVRALGVDIVPKA